MDNELATTSEAMVEELLNQHSTLLSEHSKQIAVLEYQVQDLRALSASFAQKIDAANDKLDLVNEQIIASRNFFQETQAALRDDLRDKLDEAIERSRPRTYFGLTSQILIGVLLSLLGMAIGFILR